ncbi:hypothetical protein LSH36_481g01004 [Paralvinella palmiformis]|uniref:Optineurin n=1 Tax=Paralvinella palmiformis TaxID=53620 RepID=A0AAD9MX84_9ANNE|nr:hypothetical protein LSH36_481g01004 [Paralvinella palmiformis]
MSSNLKQPSSKSGESVDNRKDPPIRSDVGESAIGLPLIDNSIVEDFSKGQGMLMIQNLLQENIQLQDTIRQGNAAMNKMETVLQEVYNKHMVNQQEMKNRSEQAKSIIFNLRHEVQTLQNQLQQKQSTEMEKYKENMSCLKKEYELHGNDKDNMKTKMEEADRKVKGLNTIVERLQDDLTKMKDECILRESQMSQLVQQNKKLVEEKKRTKDITQQSLEQTHKLQKEIAELKQCLALRDLAAAEDAGQPIASKQQDASFSEIDGKILRVKSEGDMKSELDYRKELEVERQKVNNLTSRINELTIAGHGSDNIETLKAQVVCLVKEVSESEKEKGEIYGLLEHFRERCQELESHSGNLSDELHSLRSKDDHVIETLRSTLSQMERSLAEQKSKHEEQRAQIEEKQISLEELRDECSMLKIKLEEAKRLSPGTSGKILITLEEKRDQEDKLGRAAAQLLTADDTIIQKQEEIRKLQEKISILERNNQDVLYLKSQIDSYKTDFEEEKLARIYERKKLNEVHEELEQMRLFNGELQRQLEQLSLHHLSTTRVGIPVQPDHMRGQQYSSGGFDECDKSESGSRGSTPGAMANSDSRHRSPDQGTGQTSERRSLSEPYDDYTCPTCGLKTQDYDSLVIHADECVNDSNC